MDNTLQQLIEMTHYLGDPNKNFAMLGEGNTSARVDGDTFYVKASGTSMGTIGADGFIKVSISKVVRILDDPNAGDGDVTRNFEESLIEPGEARRSSTEAMLHATLLQIPEFAFVGHAHPVYTNIMLLSSVKAEEAAQGRLFPRPNRLDGAALRLRAVCGPRPGARPRVKRRLEAFIEEEGAAAHAGILMQNHGLIAMGATPKAVLSCMQNRSRRNPCGLCGAPMRRAGRTFCRKSKWIASTRAPMAKVYRLKLIAGGQK